MKTFAERLKKALERRGLSQAEAARLCGIAQQSLNYIISNNLVSSKLAPQIANALKINPEWLILGYGKFEETKVYEIPIIHSPYMLKKFLQNQLKEEGLDYTVIDVFIGDEAFAYLIEPKKIAICANKDVTFAKKDFLNFDGSLVTITKNAGRNAYPVFEWRIRNVDFGENY